ncbi:MAG: isopentenyl phosphate kinase [Ardenticatenia bacterium]|nr:isopentenyl phosphate kinase [Ardenticatenia bacterium]
MTDEPTRLIFVKFGGSLITDKTARFAVRHQVLTRLAQELAEAMAHVPELRVVVGHGSGSFGHLVARETGYRREHGFPSARALAHVGDAAARLNAVVRAALLAAGVPAVSVPPSASGTGSRGELYTLAVEPYERLLAWGGVPLTYGDVVMAPEGGTVVSTETIFRFLAPKLRPVRILLLGDVAGVYTSDPHTPSEACSPALIPTITPATWTAARSGLAGARGADVTGGMAAKVNEMVALVRALPGLEVLVASGLEPGMLRRALLGHRVTGTWIRGAEST